MRTLPASPRAPRPPVALRRSAKYAGIPPRPPGPLCSGRGAALGPAGPPFPRRLRWALRGERGAPGPLPRAALPALGRPSRGCRPVELRSLCGSAAQPALESSSSEKLQLCVLSPFLPPRRPALSTTLSGLELFVRGFLFPASPRAPRCAEVSPLLPEDPCRPRLFPSPGTEADCSRADAARSRAAGGPARCWRCFIGIGSVL